jgi:hypothetical protein
MPDEINGKLDTLISKVDENSDKLGNIETLLIGTTEDTGKIGLIERIRNVEKWIEKREWFEKVIIVAIVGNAIGLIFLLIQSSF